MPARPPLEHDAMRGSPMSRLNDLTGQRFGRLTVLERGPNNNRNRATWKCRCDCGTAKTIAGASLVRGYSTSCGCYNSEQTSKRNYRHGLTNTAEYRAWTGMFTRCTNPEYRAFSRYGGRGIIVCERWSGENGFANFLNDMGFRPSTQHSLDRINVDGNYEPENCRWATQKEQMRNTKNSVYFTYRGETKTLPEWAELLGIAYHTLYRRIKNGWPLEKAFTKRP